MSNLERGAIALDEARRNRLAVPNLNFEQYMQTREADKAAIKSAVEFHSELHNDLFGSTEQQGATMPWGKTHDNFRFRKGELTTWIGFNGHMKSLVTGFCMLDLMHQDNKVCIASFEMKPHRTLKRMACQAIGTSNPTESAVTSFLDWCDGRLWLVDQQGTVKPERILAMLYYCAEQLGITHFVIDSLMKVIADEDDYNGQKRFVDQLCAAAKDLNIHIHLVHHSRKSNDERKRPGKQDTKGTGAIVDQTDNFIAVFRVPEDARKDDSPDFILYLDKQRHGEWEGGIGLWFDGNSLQFKAGKTNPVKKFY
jgi:twinkle protein